MPEYKSTLLVQSADPQEIQKADLDLLQKINESSSSLDELSSSVDKLSDAVEAIQNQIGGIAPISYTRKGAILNSYVEIDSVDRSFSTTWADGKIWAKNNYAGNSKLLVMLYLPARNDSSSWGGGYVSLQYSVNDAPYVSLGQSGYDQVMHLGGAGSIDSNSYHFLLDITGSSPCTVQFKCQHRAYDGTLYINTYHEAQGDFYSKLTVLEIAKDDQRVETPSSYAYYRPAFYRYQTTDQAANQYIHLKTNQNMNNVMFAVQFQGYEYGSSKPIDSTVVGYPYQPANDVINKGTSGTHTCGAYKSSDGYVVLTIYLASTYYVGLLLNQIGAGPQGLYPLNITSATYSSSATGVY